jgi:hypothetical protein
MGGGDGCREGCWRVIEKVRKTLLTSINHWDEPLLGNKLSRNHTRGVEIDINMADHDE